MSFWNALTQKYSYTELERSVRQSEELLNLLKEIRKKSLICNPQSERCRDWIPECVIEYFSHVYEDKIFCDIGCGPGGAVFSAARFAKMSIGVDILSHNSPHHLLPKEGDVRKKMMKYATREDTNIQLNYRFNVLEDSTLPVADFYIMAIPFHATLEVIEKLKRGHKCMVLICCPDSSKSKNSCANLWHSEQAKNFLEKNSFNYFYYDKIMGRSRIIAFKDFTGNVEIADKPKIIDNYEG